MNRPSKPTLVDAGDRSFDHDNRTQRRFTTAALAFIMLLGVFVRFYAIDRQLYWNDEVYTSLRIAGYQLTEIEAELRDQQFVRAADMQKYQVLEPNKSVRDTVQGLAKEEPQLAPLYFILARLWVKNFGDSTGAIRSFSAFLSLLALPCVYWLCRELFKSSNVGLIATALFAISPAQVVFAQEARPYSFYCLMSLLSSIALLRAMRANAVGSWAIYAVTVATGLYTQVLFGLVAVGHAIYVFTITRFAICRTSIRYVVASATALAAFFPWMLVIILSGQKGTSWTQAYQSWMASATRWSGIVSRTFLDLGVGQDDPLSAKLFALPLVAMILLLIAYSIIFLISRASIQQWLFVVTLIASVALPLFLVDITQNRRYGTTRYIFPSLIGVQISVAYLLSTKISDFSIRSWRRVSWQAIGVILVLGGCLSCALRSERETWWNKSPGDYGDYPQIARIVNQLDQPILYCYGPWRMTQILCHRLDPRVRLQLLSDERVPQLSSESGEVFLFNATEAVRSNVATPDNLTLEQTHGALWKIVQQ